MKVAVILILIILLLVFAPLAEIWALNTLFGLGIAYVFKSWLAMVILNLTIFGAGKSSGG